MNCNEMILCAMSQLHSNNSKSNNNNNNNNWQHVTWLGIIFKGFFSNLEREKQTNWSSDLSIKEETVLHTLYVSTQCQKLKIDKCYLFPFILFACFAVVTNSSFLTLSESVYLELTYLCKLFRAYLTNINSWLNMIKLCATMALNINRQTFKHTHFSNLSTFFGSFTNWPAPFQFKFRVNWKIVTMKA